MTGAVRNLGLAVGLGEQILPAILAQPLVQLVREFELNVSSFQIKPGASFRKVAFLLGFAGVPGLKEMGLKPSLAVTVSSIASSVHSIRAREQAAAWGLPYLERRRNASLPQEADALLVLGGDGWTLRNPNGVLRFSPGMAQLRIQRIDQGFSEDMLIRVAELRSGDEVLDCTMGLGADALVCARAVGPTGKVVALEKSLALYALAVESLQKPYAEGFAPIEVRHADSARVLEEMPAKSFDVVLFDPMFGRPNKSSQAFEMLRHFADPGGLTAQMLSDARRAARRWVVVKGSRYSKDFKKLGLVAEQRSLSRGVLWARVPAE